MHNLPESATSEIDRAVSRMLGDVTYLTVDELVDGDLDDIRDPGPLVTVPGSAVNDIIARIEAISAAMLGGAAFDGDVAVAALRRLIRRLR